jgi:hypothetical protein
MEGSAINNFPLRVFTYDMLKFKKKYEIKKTLLKREFLINF